MKNRYCFSLVVALALFFLLFACSKAQLHPADPTHSTPSGVQLLESIENAFVSIAERSNPAVVGVTAFEHRKAGIPP